MIELSVGLISGEIVWLALEGLIRQKTSFNWELLICEKTNYSQIELYKKYIPQLKEVNCVQVRVIPAKMHSTVELKMTEKLRNLFMTYAQTDILVYHANDTYSHPTRLQESIEYDHEMTYLDYQLCYSPSKKQFVQQTDRINCVYNKSGVGENVVVNRKGFVVRKTTSPYLYQKIKLNLREINPELKKSINEIKDYYKVVHFVYVYIGGPGEGHGGPIWRELYYSVKSIHRYFKGSPYKIFVVGDHPRMLGVTHIPCERIKGRRNAKAFDATKKLIKIVNTPQIDDNFIYMYDDIIFLKNLSIKDFIPVMAIDHVKNTQEYFNKGRVPSEEWIKPFKLTIEALKHEKLPTYNYETHLPRYLNKERVAQVIDKFDLEKNAYMFSTLYYNSFYSKPDIQIRGSLIKADITIPYEENDLVKQVKGRKFLNYNDMGLNKALQQYIKSLFI